MNDHYTMEYREIHTPLHCVYDYAGNLVVAFVSADDAAAYVRDHS